MGYVVILSSLLVLASTPFTHILLHHRLRLALLADVITIVFSDLFLLIRSCGCEASFSSFLLGLEC